MLVLSRYEGESIVINDDIVVQVVGWKTNNSGQVVGVRLGIEAPKHIPVHREEIYNTIKDENDS